MSGLCGNCKQYAVIDDNVGCERTKVCQECGYMQTTPRNSAIAQHSFADAATSVKHASESAKSSSAALNLHLHQSIANHFYGHQNRTVARSLLVQSAGFHAKSQSLKELRTVARLLNMPAYLNAECESMMQEACLKFSKMDRRDIATACVACMLRKNDQMIRLKEIAQTAGVNLYKMGKLFKKVCAMDKAKSQYPASVPAFDAAEQAAGSAVPSLVDPLPQMTLKLAKQANLNADDQRMCTQLAQLAQDKMCFDRHTNRTPLIAAIIYVVWCLMENKNKAGVHLLRSASLKRFLAENNMQYSKVCVNYVKSLVNKLVELAKQLPLVVCSGSDVSVQNISAYAGDVLESYEKLPCPVVRPADRKTCRRSVNIEEEHPEVAAADNDLSREELDEQDLSDSELQGYLRSQEEVKFLLQEERLNRLK